MYLNCRPEDIREKVIITSDWDIDFLLEEAERVTMVSAGRVYNATYRGKELSFIHTGGATPPAGDTVLALSCTSCKHLIYTGACCGLSEKMRAGDLMLITESIGGDGYTRYMENGEQSSHLVLMPAIPDPGLNFILGEYAAIIAAAYGITLHKGRIFSSDSVIAEMVHLEQITGRLGCVGLEMETSAIFNAAAVTGIHAAAILMMSEIRSPGEPFRGVGKSINQFRDINQIVLSQAILDTLCDERLDIL